MSAAPGVTDASARRTTVWGVALAWIALYLLLMAHAGWPWAGQGVLDAGMPGASALERFGAPVPRLVEEGDGHRLLLGAYLHPSLLGLVLLLWFWSSTGRRLTALFGPGRAWLVFFAGGVAGAGAHVVFHTDSSVVGGAGPFAGILGGLGAALAWSLADRGPVARAVRRGTLLTLLFLAVLTWVVTHEAGAGPASALASIEAELGALAGGALAILALGLRRARRPAGRGVTMLVALTLGATLLAAALQAPKAWSSAGKEAAAAWLRRLEQTEFEAWQISRDPRRATDRQRAALSQRLDALRGHAWLEGREGERALATYVEALRAYTRPDVPRPWETEARLRTTFRAWFDAYEEPLRTAMGLPRRPRARFYWEPR